MADTRPTLEKDSVVTPDEPFAYQAAKFACALPFVSLLIYGAVNQAMGTRSKLVVVAVLIFLMLIAWLLAIVALCSIPKHGSKGLLLPGTIGIGISSVLLWVSMTGFMAEARTAAENRKTRLEPGASLTNLQERMRQQVLTNTNGSGGEIISEYNRLLVEAADELKGDEGIALRAMARVTSKAHELNAKLVKSAKKAFVAVYRLDQLKQRADIVARKQEVKAFLRDNAALKAYTSNLSTHLRKELDASLMKAEDKDRYLQDLTKGSAARLPMLDSMRDHELEMGKALVQLLNILDREWGKWKPVQSDYPDLESSTAAKAYEMHTRTLNEQGEKLDALQRHLYGTK